MTEASWDKKTVILWFCNCNSIQLQLLVVWAQNTRCSETKKTGLEKTWLDSYIWSWEENNCIKNRYNWAPYQTGREWVRSKHRLGAWWSWVPSEFSQISRDLRRMPHDTRGLATQFVCKYIEKCKFEQKILKYVINNHILKIFSLQKKHSRFCW